MDIALFFDGKKQAIEDKIKIMRYITQQEERRMDRPTKSYEQVKEMLGDASFA